MPRSIDGAAFGATLTAVCAVVGALVLTAWDEATGAPSAVLEAGEAVLALASWATTSAVADRLEHDPAAR